MTLDGGVSVIMRQVKGHGMTWNGVSNHREEKKSKEYYEEK